MPQRGPKHHGDHEIDDNRADGPKQGAQLVWPARQHDIKMGETREYVDGKDTEGHGVAGCCTNIKQPCDEKKRDILNVVSVHAPGTFDIFVGQQLLRAWMRISGGPLRILLVAVPTSDLDHSEYGDPSLRHHLHNHQCRRYSVIAKYRVVEGQQVHESTPRRKANLCRVAGRYLSRRLLPFILNNRKDFSFKL